MALPFQVLNPFRQRSRTQVENAVRNKFNEAFFFGSLGGEVLDDDLNKKRYIDYAYNINPDVYSVVNQIANKFTSIPYVIRRIEDEQAQKSLNRINRTTKYDYSLPQEVRVRQLKELAFKDGSFDLPLETPNPNQTWDEFWMLSETFLNTTGNVYWYVMKPELRPNAEPTAIYVLPSHLVQIVIKHNVSFQSIENPVDYYILSEGAQYIDFKAEEVIHIKYANPNYDENGSHLYGQSPLRAAWKNIQGTNKGLDLAVNTLKNGGAFGFIHAKDGNTPLTSVQGKEIKDRLKEMNKDTEDLGRIAGMSHALGFTRISLTPDELKPFDYFKYNLKQVCNVLGWDDKLLNSDDGAKYDNMRIAEKRVIIGKIVPDIRLFEQSFTKHFLSQFSKYKNTTIDFMVKELPEMQQDYKVMTEWVTKLKDKALITGNEALAILDMPRSEDPNMDVLTTIDQIMTLEDAVLPDDNLQI